jgi:hypothetical protein
MKKLLLLLLILPYLAIAQSADATPIENILLTNVAKNNNATRVIVQDSVTKELKFVLKSSLQTNISIGNKNANTFGIFSSTGTGATVPQATTEEAGLLIASDKVLINTISGKENVANKQNSLAVDGTGVKYVTVDAVNAGLDLKANLASPTFTGTVSGITKEMVGLANVDNTSDVNKPVSTATQTALNLKNNLISHLEFNNTDLTVWNNGKGNVISNTMFGDGSGISNTTGVNNNFSGAFSGQNNTTGSNNNFLGAFNGQNNTTGSQNNFIGTFSGRNNTVGSSNIFFGTTSGNLISDGLTANTNSNSSIFLGNDTKPLANNQTNQIVIGNGAVGLGSNSAILGNSSIITTGLRGRVLVNTIVDNGIDNIQNSGSQTNTGQIKSTITTGTAPLVVASTTKVNNLNADLLDGLDSSVFELVANKQNSLAVDGTGVKFLTVDATNAGLALKANSNNTNLTGIPLAPTAAAGTNTTQIATTAFVIANTNSNALLLTGDQSFTGSKSATNTSGAATNGIRLIQTATGAVNTAYSMIIGNNSSSGSGLMTSNTNGGVAHYIESINGTGLRINTFGSTGKGINLIAEAGATGNLLEFPLGKISSNGNLTSKKYNVNLDGGLADSAGNATLASGTITINTTAATANSLIQLTLKTSGGTIGTINYTTAAGSFTINSSNTLDTSTITYLIIN